MTAGALRVDAHVKVLDDGVSARAKARGIDVLVYAPHFVRLDDIRATAARYTDDDLLVLPAREVFTGSWRRRRHVLALDLESPVPDFISLEAAFEAFRRQDAVVLVPHPAFLTVSLDADDVARYRDDVHAVETFNPKHWPHHNRRARALARDLDLPAFGSSYAHLPGTVGEAWTAFPGVEPTAEAVLEALRTGAPRTVEHRSGVAHRLRCAAEFGHLYYENSLSKAALLARGHKPTNPHHPAYGGRFDADASYGPPRVRGFND